MQVLTATLFFPVTWVSLQGKSIHVKRSNSFLPYCWHSQTYSYLPELFIFLDYLFFQHLKQRKCSIKFNIEEKTSSLKGGK